MGICRDIGALQVPLAEAVRKALQRFDEAGLPVLIIETNRDQVVQNAYYAQGRESLERVNALRKQAGLYLIKERENLIITKARISNHTGGLAVDICPEIPGKSGYPWWTAPQRLWERMGKLAEESGLDWCAGGYGETWGKGWDNPHFELLEV